MDDNNIIKTDCLVIGTGLGGCVVALELAAAGQEVILINKSTGTDDSSSNLLAGGLNSVSPESIKFSRDSLETFVEDTLQNGCFFNKHSIVRYCGDNFYPDAIQWLEKLGVSFDNGLHREGSDTARVHHISDHTGSNIMKVLDAAVRDNSKIHLWENHFAFDFITNNWLKGIIKEFDICRGCYVYDIPNKTVKTIEAKSTFVATGSLGMVFPATSCPPTATGDGFAMAYRSFLPLAMMEMLQFHPTGLATPGNGHKDLCTQALRGAGAFLKLQKDGTTDFVRELGYNTILGSNADRATVSRAVEEQMQRLKISSVWLDCSPIPAETLKTDFSNFFQACLKMGLDPTIEPVPVRPILHYSNGGVLVGNHGETLYPGERGIARLYFIGENAYTGLHGADRFPSNSGPEAVLFGRLAAKHYLNTKHPSENITVRPWQTNGATEPKDKSLMNNYIETIQNTMGSLCGIHRTEEKLQNAKAVLDTLRKQIHAFYRQNLVDESSLTARNMLDVANAILESAIMRKSSAGCHYISEHPKAEDAHHAWSIVQKERYSYFMPIPD